MHVSIWARMTTAAMLLTLIFFLPGLTHASGLEDLRMSLLEGDVQIRTADEDEWVPASINTPLMAGDVLWVPDEGKAGIQLKDGSYIRLNENTSLEVLTVEDDSYQFYLTSGQVYVNFRAGRGSFLQMDTPVSSMRAYDPSAFSLDVKEDGATQLSVFRGRVDAESDGGKTTVDSGSMLSLGRERYAELSPLGPADEWERWNKEKDRRLERRASDRYLPEELRVYSPDLDENGRWVYASGYGYVWTPTVVVSGWAPYRMGRWVWIRGDYVWVSYDPWGWCPHHYGRWDFMPSIGWFWVPPVRGAIYWGPGFVGWVYTPTYVSWVPLAPRDVYYGHGYYGPHSVNITNVNITNIHVDKIVYKNVRVSNAVTVIHHDTFVTGRQKDVHVKENPFVREKIHIGRPDIKPERATLMPVVKEIPDKRRPPEIVRDLHVKELKEKRPLVKAREASVLSPHAAPRELQVKQRELRPGERIREPEPAEKRIEKTKEVRPAKKEEIQRKEVRTPDKKEARPPAERGSEKQQPKEFRPPERGSERQKPKEFKPPERSVDKPREPVPAEKRIEKPKDYKPPERAVEKPAERAVEKVERPREIRPYEGVVEKPRVNVPEGRGVEKPRQNGRPDTRIEKPQNGKRPNRSEEARPGEKRPD